MEKQIREFQGSLSSLLNHIDASTQSLTHHLDRPGVPLDSASASFLGRLGSRVGSAGNDLDRLQSAAFGSLSFEELLGHCREVWKVNRRRLGEIDERLAEAGYVCEIDDDAESEDFELDLGQVDCRWTEVEVCSTERLEKYNIFDESMTIQKLGLSDAGVAALASKEDDANHFEVPSRNLASHGTETVKSKLESNPLGALDVPDTENSKGSPSVSHESSTRNMLHVSSEEYNNLPSYMKSLASWEDLSAAVNKMDVELRKHDGAIKSHSITEKDIEVLGLGHRARTYLLLLVKLNKVSVEVVNGSPAYRLIM